MALDRDKVVRTGLRLLDEVGLEGLTLRKLANELHVQAPALYWHFKNKRELLDEMATHMLAESIDHLILNDPSEWPASAMIMGNGVRRMLLGHRDGAKMFSGTYLTDTALFAPMEAMMRRFVEAGFSEHDATCAFRTIYCYAVGFTIEEQAVYPRPGKRDPRYDPEKRAARTSHPERYPLTLAAGKEMLNFDQNFRQGLETIIRGLGHSAADQASDNYRTLRFPLPK